MLRISTVGSTLNASSISQKYQPWKQHYYETEDRENPTDCPIYGEWLAWSECSRTCGEGIRTRQTGAVDVNSPADDFRLYETGTCNDQDCRKFFYLKSSLISYYRSLG